MKKIRTVIESEAKKLYNIYDQHPHARKALLCCVVGLAVSRVTNVPMAICTSAALELLINTEKLSLSQLNNGAMPQQDI